LPYGTTHTGQKIHIHTCRCPGVGNGISPRSIGVVLPTTIEYVCSGTPREDILVVVPGKLVVTGVPVEGVGAVRTTDQIVTPVPMDNVCPIAPDYHVRLWGAIDDVVPCSPIDRGGLAEAGG
jgi:hypothetical protein